MDRTDLERELAALVAAYCAREIDILMGQAEYWMERSKPLAVHYRLYHSEALLQVQYLMGRMERFDENPFDWMRESLARPLPHHTGHYPPGHPVHAYYDCRHVVAELDRLAAKKQLQVAQGSEEAPAVREEDRLEFVRREALEQAARLVESWTAQHENNAGLARQIGRNMAAGIRDLSVQNPACGGDGIVGALRPLAAAVESLTKHPPPGLVRGNLYVACKNVGVGTGWHYSAIGLTVQDLERALELLAPSSSTVSQPSASLRLREGACYRKGDGDKVGPMFKRGGVWYSRNDIGDWNDSGTHLHGLPDGHPRAFKWDLLEEWSDTPPAMEPLDRESRQ